MSLTAQTNNSVTACIESKSKSLKESRRSILFARIQADANGLAAGCDRGRCCWWLAAALFDMHLYILCLDGLVAAPTLKGTRRLTAHHYSPTSIWPTDRCAVLVCLPSVSEVQRDLTRSAIRASAYHSHMTLQLVHRVKYFRAPDTLMLDLKCTLYLLLLSLQVSVRCALNGS